MFIQSALVYSYYLLPLSMIVVCVMISARETQNNGIIKMLALPIDSAKLSLAKFAVVVIFLFMELMLFFVVFLVAGKIAIASHNVTETLPLSYLIGCCIKLFISMLPATALIWTITVLFEKPIASVGLNLLLVIPGVLVANTKAWLCYPYCYSGYLISQSLHEFTTQGETLHIQPFPFIAIAAVIFAAALFLSTMRFGKKEKA